MNNIDNIKLKKDVEGINRWIEENLSTIGNANMYEIMDKMLTRNILREVEGPNDEVDAAIEHMISLRKESIAEFQTEVPESKESFDAVRNGLVVSTESEKALLCKIQSIAFFIYNARKRGFQGDITWEQEDQEMLAIEGFCHDNRRELTELKMAYDSASTDIQEVAYSLCDWIFKNSIMKVEITKPQKNTDTNVLQ